MKFVIHREQWWWGDSVTIVTNDGYGLVEVQFDKNWTNVAYIRGLSVFPSMRKNGLGTRLLNLALVESKERGMKFVKLAVEKKNYWLIAWYERMGFIKATEDDNEYAMVKVL